MAQKYVWVCNITVQVSVRRRKFVACAFQQIKY
jgi:hypothetical protein